MMNTALRVPFCTLALTALVACGGGGGSDSRDSFDEMVSQGNAMLGRASELNQTPLVAMPETGSATYNGYIGATAYDFDFEVLGELSLTASFDNSEVDGSARNFATDQGELLDGSLGLTGDISGNDMFGSIGGSLTDSNGNLIVVTGGFDGIFLGSDHAAIVGSVDVTVNSPSLFGLGTAVEMSGGFVGER